MANFVSESAVRDYLGVTGTTGAYSDGLIGSNIAAASGMLQRRTNRLFERSSNAKTFSTRGRSTIAIPDLRSAATITWNDASLVQDSTVYLIPDRNNSGVFVGVEIPALHAGSDDYWRHPDWFDRGYDSYRWRSRLRNTLPNDLFIGGALWGHDPYPPELLRATVVLAAWLTRRANSLLGNVAQDATGALIDYSAFPPEARAFIEDWRIPSGGIESI